MDPRRVRGGSRWPKASAVPISILNILGGSRISAQTWCSGYGGDIAIAGDNLTISDYSKITAETVGGGHGGTILLGKVGEHYDDLTGQLLERTLTRHETLSK